MVSYLQNGEKKIVGGSTEDAMMLYGIFPITEATDLNTLTSPANYYKEASVVCTNAPAGAEGVTSKFRLNVSLGLGPSSSIIVQTLTLIDGTVYRRIYNSSWSAWEQIVFTETQIRAIVASVIGGN